MSPATVDNRAVDMQFNNKQFEQGVQQSTKTLDNLKKGLDLTESAKNISNLSNTAKNFSLGGMAEGVQHISNRFSALGVVGFTIIQNLTNAAINYGKKMVQSIMEPMRMGFSEYETQINAIQTVLANTEKHGTTLVDVTAALDELNTYADQTIYNFTEMTRNIGTFTAAGVKLETSTAAIKGIANLAAVSGSTSQQASTAMYQLSQALSSGTVKLMDWNSVVNAGMGGAVFKDALTETARASGIAIDDMIEKHGSFRETLSEGWLSSDVLLDTLKKFTGDLSKEQLITMGYTEDQIAGILKLGQTANDAATKVKTFTQLKDTLQEALQSGWTKSWEIIIGDFDEAKAFFTEVSDTLGEMIGASADARNAILESWSSFGGRTALIDSIRNAFQGVLSVLTPIKEAFREVFPPILGIQLYNLTYLLKTLSERLVLSEESADKVKRIFKGLFSVVAIVKDVIFELASAFFSLVGSLSTNISGSGILEFFASIGDYLTSLREGTDVGDSFAVAAERIGDAVEIAKVKIDNFVTVVRTKFQAIGDWFREMFENVDTTGFTDFLEKVEIRLEPLSFLARIVGGALSLILKIGKKLMPVLFNIGSAIGEFVFNLGSAIFESVSDIDFSKTLDTINTGLFGGLLLAMIKFMRSGTGILDDAGDIFGGLADTLDEVGGSLRAWQMSLKAKALLAIAIAIGILAISLAVIASIDSAKLTVAMAAITGVFIELIVAMAAFSKFGGGGLVASAGLIAMSTAILILAGAVSILAKIDPDAASDALGTIFALMTGMAVFSKVMQGIRGGLISGAIGLVIFAVSLRVMANVIERLGEMDPATLTNGLIGVGVMLAQIAVFMRLVNNSKMSATAGIGLLGMAIAIMLLANTVERFGQMDVAQMQQGLIAVGALLAQLGLFTKFAGGGGMISTAIGMTILAGAMFIFAEIIQRMGSMSWDTISKGLTAMGGALLLIVTAIRAMPKSVIFTGPALVAVAAGVFILSEALEKMGDMSWEEIAKGLVTLGVSLGILVIALYAMSGTLAGSAALLLAAIAIRILAPALAMLGSMSIVEIGLALLTLAGMFVLLAIAGYALTPVVPTLLGLGFAIMLLGAGAALVGIGLLAFALGLTALAAAGTAAAVVVVGMVATLLGIVPLVINALVDALIILAEGLIKLVPVLGELITALLLEILQIIIDVTPKLLEGIETLLYALIDLLEDTIPEFVEAVLLLLVTLLEEIADKLPDFIQAGFDILIGFLEGIRNNIGEVVTVAIEIVQEYLNAVAEKIPDIIQSGIDLMIAFIDGMSDGIDNNKDRMNESLVRLANSIIDGLVSGITDGAAKVISALLSIAKDAWKAAKDWLLSKSPSKRFMELGRSIPEGMIIGIEALAGGVVNATSDLADDAVDGINYAFSMISDLLDGDINLDPTITPVMDMSDILAGSEIIDELFGRKTLSLVPAIAYPNTVPVATDSQGVAAGGSVVSFEQNNYSPKALSRAEIYRQTKNQLRAAKGLVKP
jgi:tape measure domain-containing protein